MKGKPISRQDGKPFPYRINEYPVLGCCLCRYTDIGFIQAAEIGGVADQQTMTIPQILFQPSSRPFFSGGPRRKLRMSVMLPSRPVHSADRSGWLSRVAIHGWQDILLRMRQDVLAGFHSDCIDRPGNDVPVYLLDLIRRSDQVADTESRYIMRFRNRLYQDQVRMVADIRRFQHLSVVKATYAWSMIKTVCRFASINASSSARRISLPSGLFGLTDPAEILSFQREAGQVARGRKETDFMPVQAASVFILRKEERHSGFRPLPGCASR